MPAPTLITINDGKATPQPHAFAPMGVAGGVATFAEQSADGSLTKRNLLTYTQKLPGKGRSTVLERTELVLPYVVTEVINGVSREIVHSNVRVVTEIISHPEVPKAYCKDARVLNANLQINATVAQAMDDRVGMNG